PIDTANVMSGETTTVTIPNPPIEWVLQFFNQNDVIQVEATSNNITTFANGSGVDVGSIEVSDDGVTYTPISFPFTPTVGTWYFKRSTALVTGSYTISE